MEQAGPVVQQGEGKLPEQPTTRRLINPAWTARPEAAELKQGQAPVDNVFCADDGAFASPAAVEKVTADQVISDLGLAEVVDDATLDAMPREWLKADFLRYYRQAIGVDVDDGTTLAAPAFWVEVRGIIRDAMSTIKQEVKQSALSLTRITCDRMVEAARKLRDPRVHRNVVKYASLAGGLALAGVSVAMTTAVLALAKAMRADNPDQLVRELEHARDIVNTFADASEETAQAEPIIIKLKQAAELGIPISRANAERILTDHGLSTDALAFQDWLS